MSTRYSGGCGVTNTTSIAREAPTMTSAEIQIEKLKDRVTKLEEVNLSLATQLEYVTNELNRLNLVLSSVMSGSSNRSVGYWEES